MHRTGPKTKKVERKKSRKRICSEESVESAGNRWSQCCAVLKSFECDDGGVRSVSADTCRDYHGRRR